MPTTRIDPYRGARFWVEIDGMAQAGFQEASGLDVTTEPVDYREGSDPPHVRKLPGLTKYSAITLKRGITNSDVLWVWHQAVINGKNDRRNGSIVLLDDRGVERLRWNFINAWPSKWVGPAFNATSSAVAIETLELTPEEIERAPAAAQIG